MDSTTTEQGIKTLVERHDKIERQKDWLVELVEGFFAERQRKSQDEVPVRTSQLQNLTNRANETKSVKEIVNFIRYQIGRDTKRKGEDIIRTGWAKDGFGDHLIGTIEIVRGQAATDKEVAIQLVRLFLGYFQRHARYLEAQKPGSQTPQASGKG